MQHSILKKKKKKKKKPDINIFAADLMDMLERHTLLFLTGLVIKREREREKVRGQIMKLLEIYALLEYSAM
jgi:hypothetical protein